MMTRRSGTQWLRGLLRLRLLTALLIVALVGLALAGPVRRVHRQKVAVRLVLESGGTVRYDWQPADKQTNPAILMSGPPGPAWLRRLIGDEYFQKVVAVEPSFGGVVGINQYDRRFSIHTASTYSSLLPSWKRELGKKQVDEMIKAVCKLKHLRHLSLASAPIDDESLAPLRKLKQLESLDLSLTNLTGEGLTHIRKLGQLRELDLESTYVGDSSLDAISNLAELRTLNLCDTAVRGRRLSHLARLTKLEVLNLSFTVLTPQSLNDVPRLVALQELHLKAYRPSDEPWSAPNAETAAHSRSLKAIADCNSLKKLDLRETTTPRAAVELFRKRRPSVELFKFKGLTAQQLSQQNVSWRFAPASRGNGGAIAIPLINRPTMATNQTANKPAAKSPTEPKAKSSDPPNDPNNPFK